MTDSKTLRRDVNREIKALEKALAACPAVGTEASWLAHLADIIAGEDAPNGRAALEKRLQAAYLARDAVEDEIRRRGRASRFNFMIRSGALD